MKNHPAFQRLVAYIDTNNLTPDDIRNATVSQVLKVLYPPDGIRPADDYLTKELVLRGLASVWEDRKAAAEENAVRGATILGRTIKSVTRHGENTFLVELEPA